MNENRENTLLHLAESIADGRPVDWPAAGAVRPELGATLDRLRLVHKIAAAHRGLPAAAPIGLEGPTAEIATAGGAPLLGTWGPLQILEKLGEGGFGEVFRAFDPSLQREVALKLRQVGRGDENEGERRFLTEARRLARVRHPNVLVVHGADRHEGRVGLWMDLLHGKTLEEYLTQQGPLGAQEATVVGLDLCRALAAVHAAGLVHRDVKAANVMREQGGRIVLMDFGSVGELSLRGDLAIGQSVYGTPLTMAPEQLIGRGAGRASDIYGLGVLLYRLASGSYPIEADSIHELVEKHRQREFVPLRDRRPDLPTEFVQVVEKAIDPDPARRFQSAGAMERALGSPRAPYAGADASAAPPWWRTGRRLVPVFAVAALIGVVFAGVALMSRQSKESNPVRTKPGQSEAEVSAPSGSKAEPGSVTPQADAVQSPESMGAPLTATAALYRQTDGMPERLLPNARISPGDRLFMEIEGPQRMYLYVLNEDEAGNVFVLFPLHGFELSNPLAPNTRIHLPGQKADSLVTWRVTSTGGTESIIAIASRQPLGDLERDIAHFPQAARGRPVTFVPVSRRTIESLRGIGGVAVESPSAPGAAKRRLAEDLRNLSQRPESAGNAWIWQIPLENHRQGPNMGMPSTPHGSNP